MKFDKKLDLIFNEDVAPGIESSEIIDLDDYIEHEIDRGKQVNVAPAEVEEDFDDAIIQKVDPKKDIIDPKLAGEKGVGVAERVSKLLHSTTLKGIVNEKGDEYDLEQLKDLMSERPKNLIAQNIKLKKSGTNNIFFDLTIPAYQGLYFDEKNDYFAVVRTCPSAGECKKFCYAAKGGYVMFPVAAESSARMINYLMNDYKGFKKQLISELSKKRRKNVILRWHDAGDFFSEQYLEIAYDVAKETPNVTHYAYTKQIPLVKKLESKKPDNFIFNYSFSGQHDDMIDVTAEKYAKVVPKALFKDLFTKVEGKKSISKANVEVLKDRVAEEFGIERESIITYTEMMKTKEEPNRDDKFNVLVWAGHGDDAAVRRDVLGTLLLFH